MILRNKMLFVLLIPLLLAITINCMPQSSDDASTRPESNTSAGSPSTAETKDNATASTNSTDDKPTANQTSNSKSNTPTESKNSTESNTPTESKNSTESNTPTESKNSTESNTPTESKNSTESNTPTESKNSTETNTTPSQAHPPNELRGYNCPKRNGFFRYPGKCDVYIECKDYIPLTYICPDGLQFNPNAGTPELICDDPSVVKCNPNDPDAPVSPTSNETLVIKVPPGEHNGTPRPILYIANLLNTTYNPIDTSTSRPANVLNGYICPMRNGVFGYPGTCDVYVKCEDNSPLLYKCLDGLQFNPNPRTPELFCDDPSVVNCNALTAVTIQQPTQPPQPLNPLPTPSGFNCPSPNGYYKYPGRCDEYFECRVYAPIRSVCPYGLRFNPDAKWTDYPCVDPLLARC